MSSHLSDHQRRTLDLLNDRLDQIAVLPAVITKLMAADPSTDGFADTVIALAESDPPFALRLLRLAAVAGAGISYRPPDTIPTAILRVGVRPLADLLLSLSVVNVFVPRTRGQRNLWVHSIQVAMAARRLAHLRPEAGVSPEQAYLGGLLHDIGRFVLFEHRPEELGQIDEARATDPNALVEAERRVCGFDHAELGWHVCEQWKMPDTVTTMVRYHHRYRAAASVVPPEVINLVRFVQQADCISFGLLQTPMLPRRSDRRDELERLTRLVGTPIVSLEAYEDHLVEIDRDSRVAASVVDIAVDTGTDAP